MSAATVALALSGAAAMTLAVAAPAAAGGPPQVEQVDRTFVNLGLSEQCGVEVTQHLWGIYSTVETPHRTITSFHSAAP